MSEKACVPNLCSPSNNVYGVSGEIVNSILSRGYAKDLPPLPETEGGRGLIYCERQADHENQSRGDIVVVPESLAISGLKGFLKSVFDSGPPDAAEQWKMLVINQASYMHDTMSFITHDRLEESTTGIAAAWKHRLSRGESLYAIVGDMARRDAESGRDIIKSCEYILECILQNFDADEIRRYGETGQLCVGNAVDAGRDLERSRDNVTFCIVDDWAISGAQIRSTTTALCHELGENKREIECWLVVGTEAVLNNGVNSPIYHSRINISSPSNIDNSMDKVYAYFKVPDTPEDIKGKLSTHHPSITGSHCTSDYGFLFELQYMANDIGEELPLLAGVVPPYKAYGFDRENKLAMTGILRDSNNIWYRSQ